MAFVIGILAVSVIAIIAMSWNDIGSLFRKKKK